MRKVLAALFAVILLHGYDRSNLGTAADLAASAPAVPNTIVRGIAVQTMVGATENLSKREAEVQAWLQSVGGNNFFKNYQNTFEAPANPQKRYVAETGNVTSSQLGLYYIHQPATSGETVTAYPCDPPNAESSITIRGLCALGNWNAYILTHDTNYRTTFLKLAKWFLNNNDGGRWLRTENIPSRQLISPWISGLSQSLGISILLRAYQTTSDNTYLRVAEQAFSWIARPIEEGGATCLTNTGTWIEEYPNAIQCSHVLNGHIWGLFGVWDYYRVTKDPNALRLFDDGIAAIKHSLSWFDTGYWIVYDHENRTDMVIGIYMQFIIQQFYALYAITADTTFLSTADKWEKYQASDALFLHRAAADFMRARRRDGIAG